MYLFHIRPKLTFEQQKSDWYTSLIQYLNKHRKTKINRNENAQVALGLIRVVAALGLVLNLQQQTTTQGGKQAKSKKCTELH